MTTPQSATHAPSFRVEPVRGHERAALEFSGRLTFAETTALWNTLRKRARAKRGEALDLSQAGLADGGMALLVHVRSELQVMVQALSEALAQGVAEISDRAPAQVAALETTGAPAAIAASERAAP